MYQYTENLDGWEKEEPTNSCFLPANYFYKALLRYPGTLVNPLVIRKNKRGKNYIYMKDNKINPEYPGLLRLVIDTPNSKHSNLLILDFKGGKVFRFEPLGENTPGFEEVNSLIEDYLGMFFDFELEIINLENVLDEKNPSCDKSGFCVAYIILYAYSYLNGQEYYPRDIRRFAKKIEKTYGSLPYESIEIEYGLLTGPNTNTGRNMLVGGLGGLAIGGLAGGGTGALIGGLGGAAIGGLI